MRVIEGNNFVDDRGILTFYNGLTFEGIKRVYLVRNHQAGYIRAWHGHKHEGKYVQAIQGSALVAAAPLENMEIESTDKYVLSEHNPRILYIPPGYANGFKTLTENCILQFFSTSTLEESRFDDIRFHYNKINIWENNYR